MSSWLNQKKLLAVIQTEHQQIGELEAQLIRDEAMGSENRRSSVHQLLASAYRVIERYGELQGRGYAIPRERMRPLERKADVAQGVVDKYEPSMTVRPDSAAGARIAERVLSGV